MMHVCNSESPWENGRAERHGGWVKGKVEAELQATGGVVRSQQDLDDYIIPAVTAKNRYFHRGGYTPMQL
eukprot:3827362-Alexandrium_andersonii.AAC.1